MKVAHKDTSRFILSACFSVASILITQVASVLFVFSVVHVVTKVTRCDYCMVMV